MKTQGNSLGKTPSPAGSNPGTPHDPAARLWGYGYKGLGSHWGTEAPPTPAGSAYHANSPWRTGTAAGRAEKDAL